MNHKAYTILMALELTSIGIKYEGSCSNPLQHLSSITLLFITTMFCHVVVAFTAEMTLPTTILVFHVSGIVGYQTLLWIVVAEFSWWYIINVIVLLVASFCFKWHMSNATFWSTRSSGVRLRHDTNIDTMCSMFTWIGFISCFGRNSLILFCFLRVKYDFVLFYIWLNLILVYVSFKLIDLVLIF